MALDDVVYAQPLVVPDVAIAGGKHDVVYVVTENNTIYAIDGDTGSILLTRNLGSTVPLAALPGACNNNGPRVGIESTPVIDLSHHAIYLISYTKIKERPAYLLYAVDLSTLGDQARPVVVSASHTLADGSAFVFNAANQRQRAALLLANGNVYAGFASWCDHPNGSRGWLLGWRAFDLKPLAANILDDRLATSPVSHLSSIWMSGYGMAADASGHLYFATGNSNEGTHNSSSNLSESVVKVAADLTHVAAFFTPSNVNFLDQRDIDLGSGGVLLLPDQPGKIPHLAAAAGKDGRMFLINREHLGGFSATTDNNLGTYSIGSCWCGQSYYLNNIVSSGDNQIGVWRVNTSPKLSLTKISSSISTGGPAGDNGGFFTAVSSNGASNVMIWAVSRQRNGTPPVTLFAFQPVAGSGQLKLLFQSTAGNWNLPSPSDANPNIVPVVANGHVYVASYKELDVFGFVPPQAKLPVITREFPRTPPPIAGLPKSTPGLITKVNGSRFSMKTAVGSDVQVDAGAAIKNGLSEVLAPGRGVSVQGSTDAQGILHADIINRASFMTKP
ncbi:MAG: hypothetical protein M3Z23_14215 [Acidobacteriota bacterium]|nr:hypothetical protein [Acidobacteriota bacterium]